MLRHVFVETAYTEVLSGIEHSCDVCFPPGMACVLLCSGPAVLKLCPLIKETVVYSLTVTPGDAMATAAYPTHSLHGVAVWQVDAWRAKSVTTQSQTDESLPEASSNTMMYTSANMPVMADMTRCGCMRVTAFMFLSFSFVMYSVCCSDSSSAQHLSSLCLCPCLDDLPLPVPHHYFPLHFCSSHCNFHFAFIIFLSCPLIRFNWLFHPSPFGLPFSPFAYPFILLSFTLIYFFPITPYPFASPTNAAFSPGIGCAAIMIAQKERNYRKYATDSLNAFFKPPTIISMEKMGFSFEVFFFLHQNMFLDWKKEGTLLPELPMFSAWMPNCKTDTVV